MPERHPSASAHRNSLDRLDAGPKHPPSTTKSSSVSGTSTGGKVNQSAFIHKLYNMLEDESIRHLISWTRSNDSFVISPGEEFSKVLALYFKHTNVSSFVRQLNMYGFHKVNDNFHGSNNSNSSSNNSNSSSSETAQWEFKHGAGSFKRGDTEALRGIKRRASRPSSIHRDSIPLKSVSLSVPSTPPPGAGLPNGPLDYPLNTLNPLAAAAATTATNTTNSTNPNNTSMGPIPPNNTQQPPINPSGGPIPLHQQPPPHSHIHQQYIPQQIPPHQQQLPPQQPSHQQQPQQQPQQKLQQKQLQHQQQAPPPHPSAHPHPPGPAQQPHANFYHPSAPLQQQIPMAQNQQPLQIPPSDPSSTDARILSLENAVSNLQASNTSLQSRCASLVDTCKRSQTDLLQTLESLSKIVNQLNEFDAAHMYCRDFINQVATKLDHVQSKVFSDTQSSQDSSAQQTTITPLDSSSFNLLPEMSASTVSLVQQLNFDINRIRTNVQHKVSALSMLAVEDPSSIPQQHSHLHPSSAASHHLHYPSSAPSNTFPPYSFQQQQQQQPTSAPFLHTKSEISFSSTKERTASIFYDPLAPAPPNQTSPRQPAVGMVNAPTNPSASSTNNASTPGPDEKLFPTSAPQIGSSTYHLHRQSAPGGLFSHYHNHTSYHHYQSSARNSPCSSSPSSPVPSNSEPPYPHIPSSHPTANGASQNSNTSNNPQSLPPLQSNGSAGSPSSNSPAFPGNSAPHSPVMPNASSSLSSASSSSSANVAPSSTNTPHSLSVSPSHPPPNYNQSYFHDHNSQQQQQHFPHHDLMPPTRDQRPGSFPLVSVYHSQRQASYGLSQIPSSNPYGSFSGHSHHLQHTSSPGSSHHLPSLTGPGGAGSALTNAPSKLRSEMGYRRHTSSELLVPPSSFAPGGGDRNSNIAHHLHASFSGPASSSGGSGHHPNSLLNPQFVPPISSFSMSTPPDTGSSRQNSCASSNSSSSGILNTATPNDSAPTPAVHGTTASSAHFNGPAEGTSNANTTATTGGIPTALTNGANGGVNSNPLSTSSSSSTTAAVSHSGNNNSRLSPTPPQQQSQQKSGMVTETPSNKVTVNNTGGSTLLNISSMIDNAASDLSSVSKKRGILELTTDEDKGSNTSTSTSPRTTASTNNGNTAAPGTPVTLERSMSTTSLRHGSSVQLLLNPTPSNTTGEGEDKKTEVNSANASTKSSVPIKASSASSSASSASVSSAVSPVSEKTKGPSSVSRVLSPGGASTSTAATPTISSPSSSISALRVSKKLIFDGAEPNGAVTPPPAPSAASNHESSGLCSGGPASVAAAVGSPLTPNIDEPDRKRLRVS